MQRFRSGEEDAFDSLFRQHFAPLCLFAVGYGVEKMAAEDIVEEALIKAWEQKENFTQLPALRSFLYTVTRNASLNFIRDRERHRRADNEVIRMQSPAEPDFSESIIRAELYRELHEALQRLPPLYRQVLELCYLEELDYQQIADRLGRPVNTIRMQRLRAISLLRKEIPPLALLLAALIT